MFYDLGVRRGDVVHFLVGNHNHLYPACFGVWILGAVLSLGDVNLEAKTVARQLKDAKVGHEMVD